ncbi:hypothetical protein [Acinetobacter sp. 251-1]|uniref:hypothetical protein n=1 Tax=Acinetobacter sp. 251-1 TaxID=2746720 RepID=UPI0025757D1D|nr:hypothetical protein [Acinetobacter sp. 251-1]MDM1762176.1 hypothetical protein [Acinetobacter sp. 251-1]
MNKFYLIILSNFLAFSATAKEIEISRLPLSVETNHPQHKKDSISTIQIQENDTSLREGAIGEENKTINLESLKKKYSEKFDSYGQYISSSIPSSPKIGMSTNQVLNSSWGNPTSKRSTEYKGGISESWYYKNLGSITFSNGKVEYIHRNN